ncbi:MAG: hypothetical protein QOJ29_1325, partial [Thermoleophilaceae bacterium]|nr:hypothetical protein [Thermoleophilaceae bacterium]
PKLPRRSKRPRLPKQPRKPETCPGAGRPLGAGRVAVIAVTNGDRSWSDYRVVLGLGDQEVHSQIPHPRKGYAIVSTARLDPRSYGDAADAVLFGERLKKMLARYTGATIYGFYFQGMHRQDLFRWGIESVFDIDAMVDRFCANRQALIGPRC